MSISLYFLLCLLKSGRAWGASRPRETILIKRMKTSVTGDETHVSQQGGSAVEASTWLGISVSASSCL